MQQIMEKILKIIISFLVEQRYWVVGYIFFAKMIYNGHSVHVDNEVLILLFYLF